MFYATVFEPFFNYEQEKSGVNEFVVKEVNSTISDLTQTKTVNYAENAIMANESKVRVVRSRDEGDTRASSVPKTRSFWRRQ